MKEIQEIKEGIMFLRNLGNIPKEVEMVILKKLNSVEEQLRIAGVVSSFSDEQLIKELENRDYHVFIDYPF